jgi:hypothetical protein
MRRFWRPRNRPAGTPTDEFASIPFNTESSEAKVYMRDWLKGSAPPRAEARPVGLPPKPDRTIIVKIEDEDSGEMSKSFLKRIVELGDAMWRLDRAVEAVLVADVAGDDGARAAALHELDRIRGSIWATYNSASDELKSRERRARGE